MGVLPVGVPVGAPHTLGCVYHLRDNLLCCTDRVHSITRMLLLGVLLLSQVRFAVTSVVMGIKFVDSLVVVWEMEGPSTAYAPILQLP